MRRVALVLAVLGCGAAPPAKPVPPAPIAEAPPTSAPPASMPPIAPPPAPPPSEWFTQIVDYDVFDMGSSLSAFARPDGVALLTVAGSMVSSDWARHDTHGWIRESAGGGTVTGAAFDASGAPWVVAIEGGRLVVRHGAIVEQLADGLDPNYDDRAAIALDTAGKPHVCLATERANVNDKKAGLVLRHAEKVGAKWVVEKLPVGGAGCTIAIANDGTVIIGTGDGVVARAPGPHAAWQATTLGAQARVVRSPDGAIVAVMHGERDVSIARRDQGWKRSTIPVEVDPANKNHIRNLAFDVDARGRAHVVFETSDNASRGTIAYVIEGDAKTSKIADADAWAGLAIAVDALDEPHIAYAPDHTPDPTNKTIVYARRRLPGDPPTGIGHDVDGMIASCARLVTDELGAEPMSEAHEPRRLARLCGALEKEPNVDLATRCANGSIDACVVAGASANKAPRALTLLELTHRTCKEDRCRFEWTQESSVGGYLAKPAPDEARATELFQRACNLGHPGACLFAMWGKDAAFADLARLCSPALPIACVAAVLRAPVKAPVESLAPIRAVLESACKTSQRATACSALAYMMEAGLGGRANPSEALRHHLHACERYAVSSCARLLVGPLGRPAPPKSLDPDRLASTLDDACTQHDEDACLAEAAAFERGWVVPRNREQAKTILTTACDDLKLVGACKKLGRH